jgi:L-ribulose-5-phosphate 4-epimerase
VIAAALRERVFSATQRLARSGLVMGTFGNVSEIDRAAGVFAIKPSGVPYDELTPAHMVPVSVETGLVLEGEWRPSSDTPTHLELFRAFPRCGGIVHTHSEYATAFAQSRLCVRCMGTTHADYLHGDIPCTRPMTPAEIETEYERNTGLVIIEAFRANGIDPEAVPAVLVANHGPFTWGPDALQAIEHAEVLEYLARLEWRVRTLDAAAPRPDAVLIDKHYLRKHGAAAYYGQPKERKGR